MEVTKHIMNSGIAVLECTVLSLTPIPPSDTLLQGLKYVTLQENY